MLVQRAAVGDRKAREELSRVLLPRVRNLVRSLVRAHSDVDDIIQEGMVAVLRGLHTYRGEGSLHSWVDRIVARATFAYLKRLRRQQKSGTGASEGPSICDATEQQIERRSAARLLEGLPEEQRHALVLHYVMGMHVREVAADLDVPFETVRSRLRLARAKLRRRIDGSRMDEYIS